MADSRRWQAGSGVKRDDQFTRPPSFRDGHDSAPLSPDAAWHGGGPSHLSLAIGLAVLAGLAAVAFMMFSPDGGDGPGAIDGSAASGADPLDDPAGALPSGVAGNGTQPALPTLPPLPTPTLPAP